MKTLASILVLLFASVGHADAQGTKPFPPSAPDARCPHLQRPVIFIPATMGTRLVDETTNRVAWGDFTPKAANSTTVEGRRGLALPMAIGDQLRELHDDVRPTDAIDSLRIQLFPMLSLKAQYYKRAFATFDSAARREAGVTACAGFHVFAYDWRRSGDENAVLLSEFIARLKRDLTRSGAGRIKFDLIAHSGGTQIARYYLRYGGQYLPKDGRLPVPNRKASADFANVVFLGPPNAGTLRGLMATANGHKGHAALPYYDRAISGSMPGIYQLIPRARDHVLIDPESGASLDPLSFDLWVQRQWGLAHPEIDPCLSVLLPHVTDPLKRREIGLDHLRKCLAMARQYQAALDAPAPKPRGVNMILVVGEDRRTQVNAIAHPGKIKEGDFRDGDGTVPAYSAWQSPFYEERSGVRLPAGWNSVYRCGANHDGVATDPVSVRTVLRLLSESPESRTPSGP